MVSKVAVVALVAILAVPILMGYALNLQDKTHTDYKESKDPVNVTGLLLNGDYYNTAYGEIYTINTNFTTRNNGFYPILPIYTTSTSTISSLPYNTGFTQDWTGGSWGLGNKNSTYLLLNYQYGHGTATLEIRDSNGVALETVSNIVYCYYERSTNTVNYSYYNSSGTILGGTFTDENIVRFWFTLSGMANVPAYWGIQAYPVSDNNKYVDFAGGYRLYTDMSVIDLPNITSEYIATINLDSIPDSNNRIRFLEFAGDFFRIYKETVNGEIKYYYTDENDNERTYIYTDPNRTDNTYQLYTKLVNLGSDGNGYYRFKIIREIRYVGSWPTFIGEAPYYLKYNYETSERTTGTDIQGFSHLEVTSRSKFTPIIRMDSAKFTGMLFKTIHDNTYDPAAFRNNPITKITDISLYGSQITFGGVDYAVTDGNITMGTRQYPINKAVFESVPITGGYSNRINGVEVSTSVTPSTITFGGHWSAQVTTDSLEITTYTKTDWTPGQFAWDGIDQNFLMVGLLAAIGVFIALGIAYRRARAALGALLVVCGGAILLFFTML